MNTLKKLYSEEFNLHYKKKKKKKIDEENNYYKLVIKYILFINMYLATALLHSWRYSTSV
jgi:hypothetical protein